MTILLPNMRLLENDVRLPGTTNRRDVSERIEFR